MVDRKKDNGEEQKQRAEEEQRQQGNIWGNIKVLVVCMHSFFDGQVAVTFLALSLAHESCDINVEKEFLISGVVLSLMEVLNALSCQVEMLAALDMIIFEGLMTILEFLNSFSRFSIVCFRVSSSLHTSSGFYSSCVL